MWDILLISFRESFEAWLVVGVVITYLKTSEREHLLGAANLGSSLGIVGSVILGWLFFNRAGFLGQMDQETLGGVMKLIASALVAYFVVWMGHQNMSVAHHIKKRVENTSTSLGIFLVTFLSVLREGIELVIFLLAKTEANEQFIFSSLIIGIVTALLVTVLIFYFLAHYLLRYIFRILGTLLIFLGAELFSEGVLKFLPISGEEWESILALIFIAPAFYYFFKKDIKYWWNKFKN